LEHSLLRANVLINAMVSMHRRSASRPLPVAWTDVDELAQAMERAARPGRHSVDVVLAGPGEFADMVLPFLRRIPGGRLLCPVTAAEGVVHRVQPAAVPGGPLQVRVSDQELCCIIIIVDDALAFVSGAAEGRLTVVRDTDAIAPLKLVFEAAWAGSRRLADQTGFGPRLGTELGQRTLRQLCSGRTDEAAARTLHISLRTYRRYVADILRELEVSSRFQAGVRAFELGLLSSEEAGPEGAAETMSA
jgi:DNA-binding CsgD family transcriptional regulator